MSNRYSRLFRKITPSFEFINKNLMNQLDKILAVAVVIKNPLIACSGNTLNPILLEEMKVNEENKYISDSNIQNAINPYPFNSDNYDQQQNSYNYGINNTLNYQDNNTIPQGIKLISNY